MLNVFTDGGARGNPGPGAIGVYITNKHGVKIWETGKTIGITTNNIAEYKAVSQALSWLIGYLKKEEVDTIHFFLDSQLVVFQLTGVYKVKNTRLRELIFEIRQKEAEIKKPIYYAHIPREKNKEADRLVNMALDNASYT